MMANNKKALEFLKRWEFELEQMEQFGDAEGVLKTIVAALTPVAGDVAEAVSWATAVKEQSEIRISGEEFMPDDHAKVEHLGALITAAQQAESLRTTVSEYQTRLETQAERIAELEKAQEWRRISLIL